MLKSFLRKSHGYQVPIPVSAGVFSFDDEEILPSLRHGILRARTQRRRGEGAVVETCSLELWVQHRMAGKQAQSVPFAISIAVLLMLSLGFSWHTGGGFMVQAHVRSVSALCFKSTGKILEREN